MRHLALSAALLACFVVVVGVSYLPKTTSAAITADFAPELPQPFGGAILSVLPCFSAPGFFDVTVLEPIAYPIPTFPFAATYVTINTYILSPVSPYLTYTVPHPGQFIVGQTTGFYNCIIDPNPKHFIHFVEPVSLFYGKGL